MNGEVVSAFRRSLGRVCVRATFGALWIPLLAPGQVVAADCFPRATQLCLNSGRFRAEVTWAAPGFGSGAGQAVPLTADTGTFWFFSNSNTELVVKVLDGRPLNRHFWVFYGGLSDVEYTLTVTDTRTGVQEVYHNPAGKLASVSDVTAFDEEAPGAAPPAAGEPLTGAPMRLGPESQVNVTTQGDQLAPVLAMSPGGSYLVAWQGAPAGIQGRWFDAAGNPLGGEVALTTRAVSPVGLRAAADAAGRAMVVWSSDGRVVGRIFGPDRQPLTGETAIGGSPQQQGLPDVVADPAGGFLVAWPEYGNNTLRWQRFGPTGALVGSEMSTHYRASSPRLAAYPGGGFVIAWTTIFDTLDADVWALRLDAEGRPALPFPLQANLDGVRLQGYHQVAPPVIHPDGGFSVVWTTYAFRPPGDRPGLFARRFGADGQPAGGLLQLSDGDRLAEWPVTTLSLPTGRTLVLWYEQGRIQDLDGGTFGRFYDASWNPLGTPFRVNTYTQNDQVYPSAAADAAGNLVVAWSSQVPYPWIPELPPDFFGTGQDGDGAGIFAQRLTTRSCTAAEGELCLGGRFRVAVRFTDPRNGHAGVGQAIPLTGDTGAFWFFDASNAELIVKVLDGRGVNGRFWVYAGALSDVAYTITVTDTVTGKSRSYVNAAHQLASRADTSAF